MRLTEPPSSTNTQEKPAHQERKKNCTRGNKNDGTGATKGLSQPASILASIG